MKLPGAPLQFLRHTHTFARARETYPLSGVFPLTVMTLATLLVLFTLTIAQLKATAHPALYPSASSSLVARSPGVGAAAARTSGGDHE